MLEAAPGVKIVALADAFQDHLDECRKKIAGIKADAIDVPNERAFVGLDAYQKLLALPDVNYVILATPPGFRPLHLEAAVAAGKHIFTEKPVAVDGPGIRRVMAAAEQAKAKNLCIAAGTQRRHQTGYIETMKLVHSGAIGDVVAAAVIGIKARSGIKLGSRDGARPSIRCVIGILHLDVRRPHRRAARAQS
ncbi:MAG: Gfo/Idh/MocA family oxidoreductase [Pyrinomonadaceae bacterium]